MARYAMPRYEEARALDALLSNGFGFTPELNNKPDSDWIRRARGGTGTTLLALANGLSITKASASRLEKAERDGTISIGRLAEVARTLDCNFVYAFIPDDPFEAMADKRLAEINKERREHKKGPLFPPARGEESGPWSGQTKFGRRRT